MSQTELPSSVSLDYNPKTHGPGTEKTVVDGNDLIEVGSHRRKAGRTQRIFHLRNRVNGEKPVKTMAIIPRKLEEHYDEIRTRDENTYVEKVIMVNNSHLLMGYRNSGLRGGTNSGRYDFGGTRLTTEDEPSTQIPLGLYEETLQVQDSEERPDVDTSWLPEPPPVLNSAEVAFVKLTADLAKDSTKNIPYPDILRLSQVFETPRITPPIEMQATLPLFLKS